MTSPSLGCALLFGALAVACRPCEDSCQEFVALSFVSSAPTGEFSSTRYSFVVDTDGNIATCEIDVGATVGEIKMCQGNATISMSDGSDEGTTGADPSGRLRVVLRWEHAPESFGLVVRDAANTLVMSNSLTPAYQDQGVDSCEGQCRRFERELALTM